MDWSQCPLAKMYPTWEDFWGQLAEEREDAKEEKREPHPVAAKPETDQEDVDCIDPRIKYELSAADIRRRYKTKDHGSGGSILSQA